MKNRKSTAKMNTEEAFEIDLAILARDFLRSFGKLWWLTVLLAAVIAVGSLVRAITTYQPIYKASATFTVGTYNTNQSGYTFFYDNNTAAQMAKTFPYLLDSDLLLERVKADMGVEVLNGTPKAMVIKNSNLFTLSVTSHDPQAAYDILQSLIKNYPAVAEYVIGKTQLNMIDYPEFPSVPDNSTDHLKSAAVGAVIGFMLGMGIVAVHAIFRNTVRQEVDITGKLHANCLGIVPMVVPKGNRKTFELSVTSSKVGSPFKESFRGLALQVTRAMEKRKVLLVTATLENEGASTVAKNLAAILTEQGKHVILVQSEKDLKDISESKKTADYVIVDAPSCKKLSEITPFAEHADAVLFTIRQDYAKLPAVRNCFDDLNQFDLKLIGCVLNGVRTGITGYGYSYGYGYGYGYGMGYRYGRYGDYGYGEEKGGKFASENE